MNKLAVFLKVKQVSLELEAKYIKKQMIKFKFNPNFTLEPHDQHEAAKAFIHHGLREHLKYVVAVESRATNIARAYLRGKPYAWVEPHIKRNKFEIRNYLYPQKHTFVEYFMNEDIMTWKRVIEIIRKYETNSAYHNKVNSRLQEDVNRDVINWRNKHPQLLGDELISKVA